VGRKPSKTATEILEGLNAEGPARGNHVASPFGALTDLVRKNAEQVLDPSRCDELVDMILSSGKEVLPSAEASKALGIVELAGLTTHPAFIRAGARRGFSFYIGPDGALHRQTHMAGIAAPGPLAVEGEIDPHFYYELPWYTDTAKFIDLGFPVLVIGPAGSGKSDGIERIFKKRDQSLQIIACTPRMTADDFEGKIDLKGGETTFTPSVAAIAVRDGHGLHLEEADAAKAEACYSLYRVLNGDDMRIVRAGLTIPRHKNLRIVGTQNTEGRGDERGLHHGRAHQDESFLDRFENYVRADYPSPEIETTILMKKAGLSKKNAERIVKTATELRKAAKSGDLLVLTTMRRTIAAARSIAAGFQPQDAWRFALQNRATEADAQGIADFVNRVYGQGAKKAAT